MQPLETDGPRHADDRCSWTRIIDMAILSEVIVIPLYCYKPHIDCIWEERAVYSSL